MAEKIISPGVFTSEVDASFLPAAIADIGAVVIGPTVKGPALVPTIVTSYSEFQQKFGDSFKSGSNYYQYLTSHTAENYLKNANKLTVVRILAGDYSAASATISSSTDPAIVGGGQAHSASIRFPYSLDGQQELNNQSCSIGGVDFVFTGSDPGVANTSTTIYVVTGSSVSSSFRDTINNSASLHGLPISASMGWDGGDGPTISTAVTMSYDVTGRFGYQGGVHKNHHGSYPSSSGGPGYSGRFHSLEQITTSSIHITSSDFGGGNDYNFGTASKVFKLHTLSDGQIMNSYESGSLGTHPTGSIGTNQILTSGNKSNFRFEITSLNVRKGTFSLVLRRGDDTIKKKQVIESYTNINLDPNSRNYIGKAIGDQYYTIGTDENSKPFLQLVGDNPPKSKYVRVEVLKQTVDYLDENGNIRDGNLSASLPAFFSASNSGAFAGAFTGGSDGTVQHPVGDGMYDLINEDNSQGLDPSNNGGASGYNQYIQALDLLSNQDEYDINLILAPGIISDTHTAIASKIIDVCEDRGDCLAILDPVVHAKNVVNATTQAKTRNSSYATMYWPWVQIPDNQVGTSRWVPPSVAVSGVYSFNDKVSHEWFAPAGVNRGTIDTAIRAERNLTVSDRDSLYDSNVNPIATFPGSGVTIYGQKTLQKKASALDRVNVRRLLIKVKKFIASSSRFLVFEQNTAALRRKFLGIVNPFMEQVQSQSGLTAFRVVMDETNNTPDTIDRNQLVGQIFVQPARTAEFIVLDFIVQRTGAAFPE